MSACVAVCAHVSFMTVWMSVHVLCDCGRLSACLCACACVCMSVCVRVCVHGQTCTPEFWSVETLCPPVLSGVCERGLVVSGEV